jgi:hypothetical protein
MPILLNREAQRDRDGLAGHDRGLRRDELGFDVSRLDGAATARETKALAKPRAAAIRSVRHACARREASIAECEVTL